MTRNEKAIYIDQHMPNLTAAQKLECNTKIIWGADEGFEEWVSEAKIRYQNQVSSEDIDLVMTSMPRAGNKARLQLAARLALKKRKEDALLTDAMSHLKI